jgi:hypothetical protein
MTMTTTTEAPTTATLIKHPKLYKLTSGGKVQSWEIQVDANPDGTATIVTVFGQVGGKLRTVEDVVREGTNVGRANERNPVEQAKEEAKSRWVEKQQRSHYGLDPAGRESAVKRSEAPMLAESYWTYDKAMGQFVRTGFAKKVDWATAFAQAKLDGHRMLGSASGKLVSREGVDITAALPHISRAIADLKLAPGTVLDGELYQHGIAVTSIGGLVTGRHPDALNLEYHVYDVVSDLPFAKRRFLISELPDAGPLKIVVTQAITCEGALFTFQEKCIAGGYEGAMLRWGTKGYEAGKRTKHLLKVKNFIDGEFKVVACKEGRATFAGMAIFECVTEEGYPFEATAPGTHDEKRAFYVNRQDYIGKMLTVKYVGLTRTDKPVPYQPVALRFRSEL